MPHLNFHHLRYFWIIASEGSMNRAAQRLNVTPSSLSIQLKTLEEQLGHQLFERRGKSLVLTEAGRVALDYANAVFRSGHELLEALSGLSPGRQLLRVGAVATVSRNFQIELLRPLLSRSDTELIVHSGNLPELLKSLDEHRLDLVLSNNATPVYRDKDFVTTLLAEQPVSLVRRPPARRKSFKFPEDLNHVPLALPGRGSLLRSGFDAILGRAGIHPHIIAEVDDMTMLRLVARENPGVTLVPPVVVLDELNSKSLVEVFRVPKLKEQFFAITQKRRFPNPLLSPLLSARLKV